MLLFIPDNLPCSEVCSVCKRNSYSSSLVFIRQRDTQTRRDFPPIGFLLKCPPYTALGQGEAKSLGISQSLPYELQGLKYLSHHLLPPGCTWVRSWNWKQIWDASPATPSWVVGIPSSTLCCTQHLLSNSLICVSIVDLCSFTVTSPFLLFSHGFSYLESSGVWPTKCKPPERDNL